VLTVCFDDAENNIDVASAGSS